jgi:carbohydrate-selective porin OprB
VLEAYYRLSVTPWFRLSPRVQYIVNPGSTDTPNALVLGLRGQFTF